jgi:alpha-tubulin suppressor-like RCC1 family protein
MNINNLQIQLQTTIGNTAVQSATGTTYYLQLAKAIQQLNMGQIRTVATVASLPAAASNTGLLVFVTAVERLYFSNGTAWATIVPPIVYNNSAWSWGQNCFSATPVGKLGDNTAVNKSSPVSVVGGFTDWCQISAGKEFVGHSLAVRTNSTAWAWGRGASGQLGDNATATRSSPVSVVGGFTDWCQVAAGATHSLGVRTNGTAWAWGSANDGVLGDNTVVNKSSPVSVVGGFCDWCQISAGNCHSLGVRTNGTAWAWGFNGQGRLGDNTVSNRSSPVSVVGSFTDWCQVSAGGNHSLGVRTNGTAWAWGDNTLGKLGDNTVVSKSSPVSVIGGFTDWCQVSAGTYHSVAVRQSGTAWAWGRNYRGVIGDNTCVNKSSPVSVVGGFTDWCQVSAGASPHSVAVRTNGTVWSWGSGSYGVTGNNDTTSRSSPVSVVGGFTDWCQVSAGMYFSLAIRSTAT